MAQCTLQLGRKTGLAHKVANLVTLKTDRLIFAHLGWVSRNARGLKKVPYRVTRNQLVFFENPDSDIIVAENICPSTNFLFVVQIVLKVRPVLGERRARASVIAECRSPVHSAALLVVGNRLPVLPRK